MRRCVRMNSNGSTGSDRTQQNLSSSSSVTEGESDRRVAQKLVTQKSEQALFWAAVSGCLALTGQGASDDDATATSMHSIRDSGSASPRSPTHSVDSDERHYERYSVANLMEAARIEQWHPRLRAPCWATGTDSFCCKLATVLVSAKSQPTHRHLSRILPLPRLSFVPSLSSPS
jgi:hypothetical protein